MTGRLAGYVLTRDEEATVERAVGSLRRIADAVVVIDSGSTDRTRELATRAGARVVVHPFESFPAQRNWAIEHLARTERPEFIVTLDADEWLTDELVDEVLSLRRAGCLDADAYLFHRRVRFDGRELRWGGFAHTWLPRLFRAHGARYEERAVNEHLVLPAGAKIKRLRGDLVNDDLDSWEDYIAKHNRYSTLEAAARVAVQCGDQEPTTLRDALRFRYLRRRWLRQHVWDRLPARPALRFLQIYLLAGGVLDGRAGFRRALFEAWQEMCTDLKAEALARQCPT